MPAERVVVLASQVVHGNTIEVYRYSSGQLTYRILSEGRRIMHGTRSDERRYPILAARVAAKMVKHLEMKGESDGTQLRFPQQDFHL